MNTSEFTTELQPILMLYDALYYDDNRKNKLHIEVFELLLEYLSKSIENRDFFKKCRNICDRKDRELLDVLAKLQFEKVLNDYNDLIPSEKIFNNFEEEYKCFQKNLDDH